MKKDSPFVRNLKALTQRQKDRRRILAEKIRKTVIEVTDYPGGYALCFEGDLKTCVKVSEFIALERLSCPFLTFTLEFETDNGPIWMCVTGADGVQDFLKKEYRIKI